MSVLRANKNKKNTLLVLSLLFAGTVAPVQASESLSQGLGMVLTDHGLIKEARANSKSAQLKHQASRGAWLPDVSVSLSQGAEDRLQTSTGNNSFSPGELSFEAEQLIWDFGNTNSQIKGALAESDQAKAKTRAVELRLIHDGIAAYLNVTKASKVLTFAKKSEGNIMAQTKLESVLVAEGRGYSTDVLQAKSKLAEARARRVRAQQDLDNAHATFVGIFNLDPSVAQNWTMPTLPSLPASLEEALQLALTGNADLKMSKQRVMMAKAKARATRANSFFPEFKATASHAFKDDVDGTADYEEKSTIEVAMDWDFNLGLSDVRNYGADQASHSAAIARNDADLMRVKEEISKAWSSHQSAMERVMHRTEEVSLQSRFLELAREERKMERRTLLDVLTGESRLMNAQSDLIAAQTEAEISGYTLLRLIGQLELPTVTAQAAAE
ncbi:TolC family protein [Magnetococcus sp. PR-3]|uniref:TolC family protein n=1 Tax=Magnetococcus sp. PR-3 TaxID=3120355 RepID=UPI002FCE6786